MQPNGTAKTDVGHYDAVMATVLLYSEICLCWPLVVLLKPGQLTQVTNL
jgi:hypothetical protein